MGSALHSQGIFSDLLRVSRPLRSSPVGFLPQRGSWGCRSRSGGFQKLQPACGCWKLSDVLCYSLR